MNYNVALFFSQEKLIIPKDEAYDKIAMSFNEKRNYLMMKLVNIMLLCIHTEKKNPLV